MSSRENRFLYESSAEEYVKKWENVFRHKKAGVSTYFRQKLIERVLTLLDVKPGDIFLDLGCGTSTALSRLGETNAALYGLDISLNMLKTGRRFHGLSGTVSYVQANGLDMPFASNSFDKILSIEVETYIENSKQLFLNIHDLLRSGGTCVLTVTNFLSLNMFPIRYSLRRYLGRIRKDEYRRFFHLRVSLVNLLRDLKLDFEIESFGWRNCLFERQLKKPVNDRVFELYERFESIVRRLPGLGYFSNEFLVSLHKPLAGKPISAGNGRNR